MSFKIIKKHWIVAGWTIGALVCTLAVTLIVATAVVLARLPALDEITNYQPRQPLNILTRDGLELGQFGPERRRFVPVSAFPPLLKDALIATEDAGFRNHNGISIKGIVRAFVANLRHHQMQGGSTITQQVARNFFLSRKQSYSRKFSEVLLALKIERRLSKDQILELYMNQIYLGQHAYGFEAAAWTYFGKPTMQLSIAEAAMLAGLPKNPRFADPVEHFDRARERQQVVLMRMRETGVITEEQYTSAKAQTLHITGKWVPPVRAEYVAEMVRQTVVQQFGTAAYSQGLKVTTSIIAADQRAAVAAVRRSLIEFDRRQPYRGPEDREDLPTDDTDIDQAAALALREHPDDDELRVAVVTYASPKLVLAILATGQTIRLNGDALRNVQAALKPHSPVDIAIQRGAIIRVIRTNPETAHTAQWRITQWPDTEAALVSLDANTGRVRALVGGFDFSHSQFNHATAAWRQPGSSFKPFLYSAALEHGVQPATLINDAPLEFEADSRSGERWNPKNNDDQYDGPITLRQALARSKNLVSIRLVLMMGINDVREWASKFGFAPTKHPDNLTLALGAGSVTPMQMARAYAAFANGGFGVTPRIIESITDAQGHVLYQAQPLPETPPEVQRLVPARNVFVINSLLNEVTRSGTAAKAQSQLRRTDLYGKTGTTNDAVDAWFAGFQPSIAAVVWMGHDTPTSLGARESGGGLALPIWIDYMRTALKGVPITEPTPPDGVFALNGEWLYDEYRGGGYIATLGVGSANPTATTLVPPGGMPIAPPVPAPVPVPLTPYDSNNSAPSPLPFLTGSPRPASRPIYTTPDPLERLPPSLR